MIKANELRIGNEIKDGMVDAIHPHAQMPTIEVVKNKARSFI